MHTEAIPESALELLRHFSPSLPDPSWYLGGGTALALALGHRASEDLDFFSPFLRPSEILAALDQAGWKVLLINQGPDHLEAIIETVKVDFIRQQTPLRFPLQRCGPSVPGLNRADSRDIGIMKLHAIGSRGSKKDFIDLYCLTRKIISLEELVGISKGEMQSIQYSKVLFLKGLVDFQEAEKDPAPRMLWQVSWDEVKKTLEDEVRTIAQHI